MNEIDINRKNKIKISKNEIINEVINEEKPTAKPEPESNLDCGTKPVKIRTCNLDACPPKIIEKCWRDSSEFCQLPVLHQYCHIPKYRILCCHTCANVLPSY